MAMAMNNWNPEEHFLQNRLDDYIQSYKKHRKPVITDFLPLYLQKRACEYLKHRIDFVMMPDDEESISRCIAIPEYDDQLVTLRGLIQENGQKVTQRNVYGALLGLDIQQSKLGDVWMEEGVAYVTTFRSLAYDIQWNCTSLGKASISFEPLEALKAPVYQVQKRPMTVTSLRLDALVKACAGVSRAKAQQMIQGNQVHINYQEVNQINEKCESGDILSLRGYGRYRIGKEMRMTKAGNYGIVIEKYI